MAREIPCPTCQQKGSWFDTPYGPFCSERCKMVDLGKWLGEEYRIASPLTVEDLKELSDTDESDDS
jgi:endogenous inhibitor of DNA gyrase (YacG/DUF329 family)